MCPRCHEEVDSDKHLFENCKSLKNLYEFEEIFKKKELKQLKNIASFLKEISRLYEIKL